MNIVSSDIDTIIVSILELPELTDLICASKHFNVMITKYPIIQQWKYIKSKYPKKCPYLFFTKSCKKGFLQYAMFLIKKYKIVIHDYNERAFSLSCIYGNIETAKWLVNLGKNEGHGRINIHFCLNKIFHCCCANGNL